MLALSLALVAVTITTKAQTIDEVVSKHIEAMGGPEKMKALKSLTTEGTMQVQGMEFPFKTWSVHNTAMRVDFEAMGTTNTQVVSSNGGWMFMPVQQQQAPVDSDPETVKEGISELDLTGDLYDYKAKGNTLELIGKETQDGQEFYKIKLTRKNGTVSNILLDAKTYLVSKKITSKTIQGQEMELTEVLSNYKKTADGYTYAATIEQQPMGVKMNFGKYEYNAAVDSKLFDKPAAK
jgi:hypothetical protein